MLTYREMTPADRGLVLPMARDFYGGSAVLHTVDGAVLERAFQAAADPGDPRLRGVLVLEDGEPAGYLYITLCYATEVGGACVVLEELYLLPALRGRGLGGEVLAWLRAQYPEARRFRLEVSPSNPAARLYRRAGYDWLRYDQMTADLPD